MKVIGTGGLAPLFQSHAPVFDEFADELTMHGLVQIYNYNKSKGNHMTKDRLIYLPLGGAGEIGMNAYVYGWGKPGRERLILVDLGVTFPDMDSTPGVNLIMPDITFLKENADRLEAIFITHAHEDHVGAVGRLWPELRVPVYARAFTGHLARLKMEEAGQDPTAVEIVGAWPATGRGRAVQGGLRADLAFDPGKRRAGDRHPGGRIVHTGDFKLDPAPGVGEPWDEDALARGDGGPGAGAGLRFDQRLLAQAGPLRGRAAASRSPSWWPARRTWWWPPPSPPTSRG